MNNPYAGEWEKLNTIAGNIQLYNSRIENLKADISSVQSSISSLPYERDEDGNDLNAGTREMLYAQLSSLRSQLSDAQDQRDSLSSQAHNMASQYRQLASEYRQKSNQTRAAANQFNQLSRYRFGASTASAGADLANQRTTHYEDHVRILNELQSAAESAASGYASSGGGGSIADRGTFRRPAGTVSGNSGTVSRRSSGNSLWSGQEGNSILRTNHNQANATLSRLGLHGITYQNGVPDFSGVSHARITVTADNSMLTPMADALLAVRWNTTGEKIAQYRRENHVQWSADAAGRTADLIPESIHDAYHGGHSPVNENVVPKDALTAYMWAHNYGPDDYDTYSQDPEWQRLHEAVFPEFHKIENPQVQENREKQRRTLDNAGIRNVDFTGYVASEAWPGKWFVAGGDGHMAFLDYANHMSDYTIERYDNEIRMIDSSMIEGVDLADSDIEKPARFWAQHEDGGTKESFVKIAQKIDLVKEKLRAGTPLSELIMDENLGSCASLYFDTNRGTSATVVEGDGFYVFSGNGRHRILAAQELNCSFPIRVIGRLVRK